MSETKKCTTVDQLSMLGLRCSASSSAKILELTETITSALEELNENKQDNLTFDSTPTEGSTNPVTSDGIYTAIKDVSGEDGISCTHSWDGTTLTVTSASGTSSADLKGDKGDTGADATINGVSALTLTVGDGLTGSQSDSTYTMSLDAHSHAADDITSGTLPVARGGTGVTSNPSMLTNLGSTTAASVFAASPRPGVTGTLPIANGGTGNTTGLAASATKLATARTINGVSFDGSAAINNYGVCATAAATAAKTVTVGGTFSLVTGAQVTVKFTYANSVASPTLNVNSTGAKPIYLYGTTAASTSTAVNGWVAGAVQSFTYDGTGWVRDYWYNTTYYTDAVQCTTAAATAAKVGAASYYTLANNRYIYVMMRYANSYAGAITLNINSAGAKPIYINGSASSSSNYTLPSGMYLIYYDGTNYYFRTDGYLTANIAGSSTSCTGNAATATSATTATTATKLGSSTVGGTGTPIYLNSGTATAITSVSVAKGGTGCTTLTSGAALVGAGTSAVTTRTIRNNTATSGAVTADTALITSNTLRYAVNRTTSVAAADTNYTTLMARGSSLNSSETTPAVNGAIAWTYG